MNRFRSIRRAIHRAAQRTKVTQNVALLDFLGNTLTTTTLASAEDTTRANYFDNYVKPFSKIQRMEVDLSFYQIGSVVASDGYIYWAFVKVPAGAFALTAAVCNGSGLTFVPYTFRKGSASIAMNTLAGIPSIYHLTGILKIPKRLQLMSPGDKIYLAVLAPIAGANILYSVVGQVNYMFSI